MTPVGGYARPLALFAERARCDPIPQLFSCAFLCMHKTWSKGLGLLEKITKLMLLKDDKNLLYHSLNKVTIS